MAGLSRSGYRWIVGMAICLLCSPLALASEYRGQVTFHGLPVPGATVTATQGSQSLAVVTDANGAYFFAELKDGSWTISVEMQCFSTIRQEVKVAPQAPAAIWELKALPLDEIAAGVVKPAATLPVVSAVAPGAPAPAARPGKTVAAADAPPAPGDDELSRRAADGLLINGSTNNGAASAFSQAAAFGNNRTAKGLYNGSLGVFLGSSIFDAQPYSIAGVGAPKSSYDQITGVATFGGPLNVPHLLRHGPTLFAGYQWMRNRNANIQTALMPTLAERSGVFAGYAIAPSPQAAALLTLYPLPNVVSPLGYNYQAPTVSDTHQDAMQMRLNQTVNRKDQVYGTFAFQNIRASNPSVFGFADTTDTLGMTTGINWQHRFKQRFLATPGYRFSRQRIFTAPYFSNRQNVSGDDGIAGNDQDPAYWGPPTLVFSSGIASLTDAQSAFNRARTDAFSLPITWSRTRHNLSFGGDYRRQQYNALYQQNARGTFTFTGAASQAAGGPPAGSDFADFLNGVPDASALAYGNPDKYFRESVYDIYFTDDWRIDPELTVNIGVRWEYGAPITELKNRLVNLDVASGFASVAPVLATNPVGALTGMRYPTSLVQPDKHGFEPRLGLAWRPIAGSSLLIRAGYGVYDDTSVYQTIAAQMAQQAPLSKSLNVANGAACPLTLADGFPCSTYNFGIDPGFLVGYAQNWQLSVQRDLPYALQMTATYAGIKGTRGVQEFLPNTVPVGAVNPCGSCPIGFQYLASNGNSTRESGQIQLRRRLQAGFTATMQYAYSKSLDDDAVLGGQGVTASTSSTPPSYASTSGGSSSPAIAQDWRHLSAERGLSTFHQKHLLTVQVQYTTGIGLKGGGLMTGWRGALYKEWTFVGQLTAGSGLPQTPAFLNTVPGTGITGSIRPDSTGVSVTAAPSGYFVNSRAYAAPPPGQWGNVRRDSIVGPGQLLFNASLGRTLRVTDKYSVDLRTDATNPLNHVTFATWNTNLGSYLGSGIAPNPTFGLPAAANPMRSLLLTLRLRF